MKNGIYVKDGDVFGLMVNGVWMVVSVDVEDCVEGAISLGMSPVVTH